MISFYYIVNFLVCAFCFIGRAQTSYRQWYYKYHFYWRWQLWIFTKLHQKPIYTYPFSVKAIFCLYIILLRKLCNYSNRSTPMRKRLTSEKLNLYKQALLWLFFFSSTEWLDMLILITILFVHCITYIETGYI